MSFQEYVLKWLVLVVAVVDLVQQVDDRTGAVQGLHGLQVRAVTTPPTP